MTDHSLSRILVVEDDPGSLRLIQRVLDRAGFSQVVVATDPHGGIERFRSFAPDLVILDLHFAGESGFDFLTAANAEIPEDEYLPILVMTVDLTRAARLAALSNGAMDFLTKPVDPAEVELRVRNFLTTRDLHRSLQREKESLEEVVTARTVQLAESYERLRAEMHNRTRFMAAISHELRTPLTGILGFAEKMWEMRLELDEKERDEFLQFIVEQARDLQVLVDDLLVMGKIESNTIFVNPQVVPVDTIIESAMAFLSDDARARVKTTGSGSVVWADPIRFRQIIRNLLQNAVRYGGPQVRVSVESDGVSTRIRVADDGPPIPDELQERIFEPFFQGPNQTDLTPSIGLGLAISRSLTDLLNGRLTYRHEGGWSVFELELPTAP